MERIYRFDTVSEYNALNNHKYPICSNVIVRSSLEIEQPKTGLVILMADGVFKLMGRLVR